METYQTEDQLPLPEELDRLCESIVVRERRVPYGGAKGTDLSGFKSLRVYQAALDFVEEVYRRTAAFPGEEIYGLTRQVRRAPSQWH